MEADRQSTIPHLTLDSYNIAVSKPAAFDGATTNARGDDGGTNDPFTLFTVTGDVLVRIIAVCTALLDADGAATLEVGVANNTASLIAQTTATGIDANEIWNDTSPVLGVELLSNITGPHIIVNGLDIIEIVATANITEGQIYYICLWRPLTPGSTVIGLSE